VLNIDNETCFHLKLNLSIIQKEPGDNDLLLTMGSLHSLSVPSKSIKAGYAACLIQPNIILKACIPWFYMGICVTTNYLKLKTLYIYPLYSIPRNYFPSIFQAIQNSIMKSNHYLSFRKSFLCFLVFYSLLTFMPSIETLGQSWTIAVCSGGPPSTTVASTYGPMSSVATVNAASRHAYIYPASQLTGIAGVNLSGAYFHRATATGSMAGTPNFKIYVKEVSATDWGSTALDWATAITGATLVFNGNPAPIVGSAAGWKSFPFSTTFTYSGTQNLAVFTEYLNTTASTALSWSYEYTSSCVNTSNSNTTKYSNVTTGVLPTSLSSTNYRRPYIGFDYTISGCTQPPVAGTSVATPSFPICTGNTLQLSLTGNSSGAGLTYEWESSSTGGGIGFTSMGVAQSFPGLTTFPSQTKYYRCKVICSAGTPVYSSEVLVTVLPGLAGGTYTINPIEPVPNPNNFQSFGEAVSALSCGITGPIVFNVMPGPVGGNYNEQILIPPIGGTSATNTITFNGNGITLYYGSTNTNARYVVQLNGADYVTFNNLVIDASTGTYGWGVHFIGGADHNTISNCVINTDISVTTAYNFVPVVMSNSNTSPITAGTNGSYNKIINNTITGGYYNIVLYGNSTAGSENLNNQVLNNTIMDSYSYSLYMLGQKNDTISGNNFSRPNRENSTTTAAVYLSTGCSNTLVEKNKVHNFFDQMTTSTSTCYTFYVAADGTAAAPNRYINNLVYNMNGNGSLYGIYNTTAPYLKAYHNTIVHNYTAATAGATYGFYQTGTAAGIEYKNNIIYITRGGSGEKVGLAFVTTGSTIASNNNDIYVNSAGSGANNTGTYGTTDYATLLAWQGANGGLYDAQSTNVNPAFVNPLTANYKPSAYLVDNIGAPLNIATDILNASRSATTPDPGAYEFTVPAIDLGVSALVYPAGGGCYSSATSAIVTIKNYGAASVNFSNFPTTIVGKVTGQVTATVTATLNSGVLLPNATLNVTLAPSVNLSANGIYNFYAYTSLAADGNNTNDTLATLTDVVGTVGGTISSSHNSICVSETPSLKLTGAYGGAFQWQQSTVSAFGPWTNVGTGATTYIPSSPVTQTTHYRVVVTCNSNTAFSNTLTITVNNPILSGTTPGSRCGTGTVTLGASAPAGTSLNWYASSSGGAPLYTGPSFTTPVISSTTNFYVAASSGGFTANVGMASSGAGTSGAGNTTYGLYFDALQAFTLNSVVVYPVHGTAGTPGTVTIGVVDGAGTVLHQATVNVIGYPAGTPTPQTVSLNFNILPGTNYRLVPLARGVITGLLFEPASAPAPAYPYSISGVVSITSGTYTGVVHPELYYYFYNWSVSTGCEGPRTAVAASVVPAPALSVTSLDAAVCSGSSTSIQVSSPNDPNYTYSWTSNPTGFTGTGKGPFTVSPSITTTYIVSAIDNSGLANNGCTISDSVKVITGPTLIAGTVSSSLTNYCVSGTPVLTLTGSAGGSIQWQQSTTSSSGPWTNIGTGASSYTPSSPITQTTFYQVAVSCQSTILTTNVVTVTVDNPQIASTTPASRCGIGTVTLNATPVAGTISWYADASGGTALGTGTSFTTPVISSSTTYYASAGAGASTAHFGLLDRVGSTTNTGYSDLGLMFDAYQSFTLQSVAMYPIATTPSGNASITIALKNSAGTILQSTTVSVPTAVSPGVKNIIPLNFLVPAGTQHRLVVTAASGGGLSGLIREITSGFAYPYTLAGVASITSAYSSGATSSYYYYLYDWVAVTGCEGTRVPVLATVNPAPAISATSNIATLCSGNSANLNVTSANGGYSYVWTPGNLSGASQTVTPSASTIYTVTATDNSGGPNAGCVNVQTILVTVQPASVTIAAVPAEICQSGTSQISLTPSSGYGAGSIQWQSSSDDINFVNIAGANASSYTTPTLTNTVVYYRALVRDGNNNVCFQPSVKVMASTPAILSSTGATRCGTGLVTLQSTSSGAGTTKWYNVPAGGAILSSGSNYSPVVSASTTYYVEQSFGTTGGTPIVVSEIDIGTNDQLEITNVSGQTIDVTGWKVAVSNSYTVFGTVNANIQTLSGTMAPGATKSWTDLSSAGNYWGSNILWNPGAYPTYSGWAIILDNNNNVVDFVALNWPAATIQSTTLTIGTATVSVASKWSGNGIDQTTVASTQSISRQGGSDNNNLADFSIINLSLGTINPGMTTPFTGFGCVSDRDAVPVVVNPAPAISASATNTLVCPGSSSSLNVTSSNAGYSYSWNPGNLSGASVSVNPYLQTIYTVTAHDGTAGAYAGCDNSATVTVSTQPQVNVFASANPASICFGDNSALSAIASTTAQYSFTSATPSPATVPGSGYSVLDKNTSVTAGDLDDGYWKISLPFAVSFFGEQYDKMHVGTNGYVSFGAGYPNNSIGVIPSAAVPNNVIYLAEYDWDFRTSGEIKYFTTGTTPNRSFVLSFEDVPRFSGAGTLNGQIIIHEVSGLIDLVVISGGGNTVKTLGIENANGTVAVSPSQRNGTAWDVTSVEQWTFSPIGGSFTYLWSPTTYLDDPTSATPNAFGVFGDITYTVTIADATTGCSASNTTSIGTGDPLVAVPSASQSTICSGNSVVLSVAVTGGCAPYTIVWEDDNGQVGSGATIILFPSATTTYYYTVTGSGGSEVTGQLMITVNPTPLIATAPGLICGSGTATLTATSSVPGTSYTWSPSTNLNVTTGATVISSTTVTRTYTVTGTTALGCSSDATNTVTVAFPVSVSATATPPTVCLNGGTQLNAAGFAGNPILFTEITPFGGATVANGVTNPYPPFRNTSDDDFVEISNISSAPMNVGGYVFELYTTTVLNRSYTLPAGTIIPATSVLILHIGPGTDDPANRYLHTGGTDDPLSSGGSYGFVLRNGSVVVDAVATQTYAWPAISGITGAEWNSPGAPMLTSDAGTIRTATTDHNTGSDWSTSDAALPQTIGTYNGGYIPPPASLNYTWNPSTFLSSAVIENPVASSMTSSIVYTVTATSSQGCSDTAMVPVNVGDPLIATASSTANNFCEGESTTLGSGTTGGGLPYAYAWSDGATTIGTTASVTLEPPAGTTTYTVTVTDACSSTSSASVTVTVKPLPSLSVTKSGDICGSGSVSLSASGSGITYAWSPAATLSSSAGSIVVASPTVNTLYTVVSTGANACSSSATIQVFVSPLPAVSATATPANICPGGTSQLLAVGSLPQEPASYYSLTPLSGQTYAPLTGPGITIINTAAQLSTWPSNSQDDGGVVVNLPFTYNYIGNSFTQMSMCTNGWVGAGNQTAVTATQMRASANFFSTTVPNNTIAAWMKDMGANFPTGTGSMRHGLIGTDIYAFQWDNAVGSGFSDGSVNTISFQISIYGPASASPGRIEIIYGPQAGTLATAAAIGVEDGIGGTDHYLNALTGTGSATTTSSSWPGAGNGFRFDVVPVILNYSWAPGTFLNSTTISNPVATGVTATTTYAVTATNATTGCFRSSPVTIFVEALDINATVSQGTICAGTNDTLRVIPTGGAAPYTFSWRDGSSIIGSGNEVIVNPIVTTTYTVTASDACGGTASKMVTIAVNPLPVMVVTPPGGSICDGLPSSITMVASGANTYVWSPAQGLSATTGSTVTASSATSLASITHTVTGTISATGCVNSTTVTVYRNTYSANLATASPSSICEGFTSQLNSTFAIRTNPALLITEVTQFGGATTGQTSPRPSYFATGDDDFVEISNLSDDPINAGGLVFELWVASLLNRTYTIPGGVIIAPHDVLVLHIGTGTDNPSENYYHTGGTNNPLGSATAYGYILKSGGTILDAVATTSSGGVTYSWPPGSGVTAAQWSGTITYVASVAGAIRIGGYDNNTAADWVYASNANRQTLGTYNSYLASNAQPVFQYSWSPATFLDDATVANPLFIGGTPGNHNYVVTATVAGSGCTKTASAAVAVSPLPTVTISGPSSVCLGSPITLSFAFTGLGPWTYSYSDGTNTYGPFTSASATATSSVTPTGAGGSVITYTPTGISDSRCEGVASSLLGSAAVTIWTYSSVDGISLTSNKPFNNICVGDNIIISMNGITPASLGTGAHWKWYSGSCTSGTPVPGSTDMTYITVSPSVNTTYYVRAEGNCNTTACLSLPIVVSTGPPSGNPGLAYAPTIAFAGASDSIRVNAVPGATYYYWTTSGNSNILFDGQPAPYQSASPSVTLTFISPATSGNGIGNYHIQFFAGNACGTTNSNNIRIRATVDAPSAVTGPLVACSGQTKTYTVNPVVGAKSYQWSFQSGSGTISGNGTQTVNVTFTGVPAVLCVHGVSAFGSAGPDLCIHVTTITETPGPVTGNLTPCQGGSAGYSIAPVSGAVSYTWSTDIPGATISGTTVSATANFPANTFSGNICVTAYSGCGTSPASCLPITSGTVPPLGTITGPVDGVCSATSVNYQVPSTGATSYMWTVPSGATIQPLTQGTNSILVDFTSSYAGGNITVVSTNVCGTANGSLPVTGAPAPPVVTGSTTVCAGLDEGYTASSPGAISYSWNINPLEADTIFKSATGDFIILEWLTNGGLIIATATNACGVSLPDTLIVGEGACRLSGPASFVEMLQATVFPNPSLGRMTLQYSSAQVSDYRLNISDMTGRVVMRERLTATEGLNRYEINLGHAAKGVYMLTLESPAGDKVVIRLVIE